MAGAVPARMIDLAFALQGEPLPREHRRTLAQAVEAALPWLAGLAGAGIHRLNLSAGDGPMALLSGRTRLTLRLPREHSAAAGALAGQTLALDAKPLHIGTPQTRELLPHGTLYAHLVAADSPEVGADEGEFMAQVGAELQTLGVACRAICGRHQVAEAGTLQGYSLMLDGLSGAHSMRLLEAGLGPHRRLGCGLFVPHRSAAAVGTPG